MPALARRYEVNEISDQATWLQLFDHKRLPQRISSQPHH